MSSGSSPPLQPQLSIQHPVGPPTTSPRSPHASLSQHMTVCLHRCPPPMENCLSFMTLLTCHFSCLFHLTSLSPLRLDIPLIYNPDHNVLSLFVHVSVFPTTPLGSSRTGSAPNSHLCPFQCRCPSSLVA